jgi:repressor LexA
MGKKRYSDNDGSTKNVSSGNQLSNSKNVIHFPQDTKPVESWPGFGAVIRKYRRREGLSQPELASMIGISRNTITNWENDNNRPSLDDTKILCETLGIPLYELFGISDSTVPTQSENLKLQQYRKLSEVGKGVIDAMISTVLQQEIDARSKLLKDSYFVLPLQSTPAAAGTGCEFNEVKPKPVFVKKNRFNTEADTLIRVSGQSMEPSFHDGDLVYVKYTNEAENNDIVICSTADGAVIKRMYENKLYSLNANLPYGEKSEDDHVQIIGKVIGIVRDDDIPNEEDRKALSDLLTQELWDFEQKYGE